MGRPGTHFEKRRCLSQINLLICASPHVKSSLKKCIALRPLRPLFIPAFLLHLVKVRPYGGSRPLTQFNVTGLELFLPSAPQASKRQSILPLPPQLSLSTLCVASPLRGPPPYASPHTFPQPPLSMGLLTPGGNPNGPEEQKKQSHALVRGQGEGWCPGAATPVPLLKSQGFQKAPAPFPSSLACHCPSGSTPRPCSAADQPLVQNLP